MKRCFAFLLLSWSVLPTAMACGPIWDVAPVNHFDGVNEDGVVSWWKKIGEVDCGDNPDGTPLNLPLTINFKSSRESDSPLLGKGWMLALLESHFIPLDDQGTFIMVEPGGYNRFFRRVDAKKPLLVGGGGWVAEAKGNVVNAWADCGWKLRFFKGRLDAIFTPQDRRLDVVRKNGVAVGIRENSEMLLTVEFGGFAGEATALVFPDGRRISLEIDMRPRYQKEKVGDEGQTTQTALDRALAGLSLPDGGRFEFAYGVDPEGHPTVVITEPSGAERELAWDVKTKRIARDGAWKYEISPGANPGDYAAITRSKTKGGKGEFWHNDINKGVETTRGADGVETVVTRFVLGPLAGKLRKIEKKSDGKSTVVREPIYDGNYRLIRDLNSQGRVITYTYDVLGTLTLREVEGDETTTYEHPDGRTLIASTMWPDGRKRIRTVVDGRGVKSELISPLGTVLTRVYQANGNALTYVDGVLRSADLASGPDGNPLRVTYSTRLEPSVGNPATDTRLPQKDANAMVEALNFPKTLP